MAEEPQLKIPWYYKPWAVVLLLFFVLGPFGLPLVFKSPCLRKGTKVFLTVLTSLYTLSLIWGTFATVQTVLSFFTPVRAY